MQTVYTKALPTVQNICIWLKIFIKNLKQKKLLFYQICYINKQNI